MLGLLAAALMAPTPAPPATPNPSAPPPAAEAPAAPALETNIPWWEKITVTVDDKGQQQNCRYETSVAGAAACDEAMAVSIKAGGKRGNGTFSKVTFERRFAPGGRPDNGELQPGDTLLGKQVMYLTIDSKGAIASCKVVAVTGEFRPDYGCEEARKERFAAPVSAGPAARQAFMTVLAYGHSEALA